MPSRRAVLASCVVTLSGCSANSAGESTPEPPTIDCERATRPDPEADGNDEVEPLPYPDPPDGTADVEWASDHEEAYVRNGFLADYGLVRWHGLGVRESELEEHGGGVVVRIGYTHAVQLADGTAADSALETAAYYVDGRGALRAQGVADGGELDTTLDPTAEGRPVVCF